MIIHECKNNTAAVITNHPFEKGTVVLKFFAAFEDGMREVFVPILNCPYCGERVALE